MSTPGNRYRAICGSFFEAQYELTTTEEVEIRYRTETSTDPETGETSSEEVPYEYYIPNVKLTNKTLPAVIFERLTEQEKEIYNVMLQLKGNKPYLWEGFMREAQTPNRIMRSPARH